MKSFEIFKFFAPVLATMALSFCEVHNSTHNDRPMSFPASKPELKDPPQDPAEDKEDRSLEEAAERERAKRLENFENAKALMSMHCFKCHGVNARAGDFVSLDENGYQSYITDAGEKLVIAGDPLNSELYFRLKEIFADGDMPGRTSNRALTVDEADVLKTWITEIKSE